MENQLKLDPVKKLFKEAFEFYLNRFWKLTGIILMPVMAVILLLAPFIILHFLGINVFTAVGILAIIFFVLFFLIFQFWSVLALIYAIKDDFGILQAFQQSRHIFFSFLWIAVLMHLIIVGGFMMGFIPGIIFSVWFMFAFYLLIDQKLTGMNALLRSKEYVRGYWRAIAGRSLVILLFLILANVFVSVIISLIINKEVGGLASNIVNLILAPLPVVFMFFIYRNLVALKPELAAASVSGKKGFFIFSAIWGVLAFLLIPFLLILGLAVLVRSVVLSRATDKNLNAPVKIPVVNINKFVIHDNSEFRFRFSYPSNFFIMKFSDKLNTQSSVGTVAFYYSYTAPSGGGAFNVRVDTSEHEVMIPLVASDFKEEYIITQDHKIKGIKQEFPAQIGIAGKRIFYLFNLKTPPELLSEIHNGVNPLRDKLVLKFFAQNPSPELELILEKTVSTLEFY